MFPKEIANGREQAKALMENWVRAYCVARGESDRLLAQSPLASKLLNYLEAVATEEALNLADELQSLIVDRELEELRADGAIKLPGDSYIV